MGKIKDPVLLSKQFKLDRKKLAKLGLLDPLLNGDTRLFIDPILLNGSKNEVIRKYGVKCFNKYFGNIIRVLRRSKVKGDAAWRAADRLLNLGERPEICLGYGGSTTRGRKVDKKIREHVLNTAAEIIRLGIEDPELFSLIGLLEEGVGPDTIGDMTANAILPALVRITEKAGKKLHLPMKDAYFGKIKTKIPRNRFSKKPLLFVPLDILRDLPVATDWSDVSDAAAANSQIRDRVNEFIGNIWKLKTKEQKDQVRASALSSKRAFSTLLEAANLLSEDHYDFDFDREGHRIFRDALTDIVGKFPRKILKPQKKNQEELLKVVDEIIDQFKTLIETNGMEYLLWYNGKPRAEKAAQRLFFAIADIYCKANNIDISPEADSGGGPVDFKFSKGYLGRVLVEIKLSTGRVEHGYKTQLKVYEDAVKAFSSVFLIIDIGKLGSKIDTILKWKNSRSKKGEKTPSIVLVDATLKKSASKR
jgi:hypothetical protein